MQHLWPHSSLVLALVVVRASAFTVRARDGYPLSLIASRDVASDDAVLLLHGRTWSSGPVWATTGAIDALGRAAYALDFRGFGRTQRRDPDGLLRPSTCRDDVSCVLRHLRDRHARVHLLGWSYGGLVAQLVAAAAPELVDRLVLYASVWDEAGDYADDAGRFAAPVPRGPQTLADGLSDFGIEGSIAEPDARAFAEAVLAADPHCVDWTALREFAVDVGAISSPTLVIHGAHDPYAPPATQRRLFDALGAEEKRYVEVPGSDHVAHALTAPKVAWGREIRAFLDGSA